MKLAWPWLVLFLLATGASYAQFNGCRPGFCNPSTGAAPPSSNFLLIDTGSVLLIDTGSKFLIQ